MTRISLENINCWEDFKSYVDAMPNTKSMGDAFEQLTKLYFLIDPLYRSMYDDVWLLDDVPAKDLEYLELPRQDLGIDLIAKCGLEYHAIQCKYHSDKNSSVSNTEISTFTSLLANKKNLTHGYICSTALNTSRNFNKLEIENISNVLFDTWSSLDKDFFDKARQKLNKKVPKEKPFTPKPHQKNAITLAHKHFVKENNNRGKLIFPCGSGKSLTGFWIMEKLKANSTVVAVPSLSLVKQTLEVYLKQVVAKKMEVKWLCICSDEGIGKGDDVVTYTRDLPIPCTTDPDYIKNWLKENKKENIIIFTTYQSGRLIAEASKSLKFTFDLGIYDEAHKTVGKNENLFSYLLFEENISVKHRIFMTATERFYRGVRDDVLTMDDPDDYGDVFCHMSFKEAIEEDLLTDYKIITIEVKKEEIAGFIKDNNLVKSNAKWGKENEARSLASMIALRKAMKALPIKNAVSFHSSIERATRNKDVQEHITNTYNYKPIDTYHVSGKLPTTKRNDVVQEFAKSDRALITNSRCLTEGVDVPNIDCIVFADPRKSKVDIVQALGRALRKKDGKDYGYVVLPVIYDHKSHEIDNENFQEILNVVRGLAANDERIIEEFKDKSQNSGRVTGAREEIFSIDQALLEESELVGNLNIKLWENLSKFNWMPFEEARDFVRSLKLKRQEEYWEYIRKEKPYSLPFSPSEIYKDKGWISYPDFMGYKSLFREVLSYIEAKKIVQKYNLKSSAEWRDFDKSHIPDNIPKRPSNAYKNKGWISWSDFLGYDIKRRSNNLEYYDYEKAREKVHKLKLKSSKEWVIYCRSGNLDIKIPKSPRDYYLNRGWKSMGDWLGTGKVADQLKNYLSFLEAKEYATNLNLNSSKEWKSHIRDNKIQNIPSKPDSKYKDDGWVSWKDFLNIKDKYASFKKCKDWALKNNISTKAEWKTAKNRPQSFPKNPDYASVYKNEWNGWDSFLEKENNYLSFGESKKYVHKLNIKTQKEWRDFVKSDNIPSNIHKNPSRYFKKSGWKGFGDWLGTGRIADQNKTFKTFEEAKEYAKKINAKTQQEWFNSVKGGNKPNDIPYKPYRRYKEEWKGWADFLGKED